jgi:hypothetical protein
VFACILPFVGSAERHRPSFVVYPLRSTVNRAIEHGKSNVVGRFTHPGYFMWTPREYYTNPLETYQQGHPVYDNHEATRAAFARGMRESRICVFDASLERKLIRKYAQAMLSGCVIVSLGYVVWDVI